jgi:hypothetical protein
MDGFDLDFKRAGSSCPVDPAERGYLNDFNAVLESLPWRVIDDHPHISELANNDLSPLLPSATQLLQSLERRTKPSVAQQWWRKALSFLRWR